MEQHLRIAMGCSNGKATPPGALTEKPDKDQESRTLLLGSAGADSSEPIKVSTESAMGTSSMVTEPALSPEKADPNASLEAKQTEANAGEQKGPSGAGQVIKPLDFTALLDNKESPAKGSSEKVPRVDSHNSSHFSPLSIVGVWYYDGREHVWTGKRSKYDISIQGTELQIEQVVNNELHRGVLIADGEWLVGTVKSLHGKETGQIRLQHKLGKMVSNFKVPGGTWGVDLTATKAVSSARTHTPSPSSEKELSAEEKDEEKLKTLQRIAENAAPEKSGSPRGVPAITQQDVKRPQRVRSAGEAAVAREAEEARAKAGGKQVFAFPSDGQAPGSSGRKQKETLCCC